MFDKSTLLSKWLKHNTGQTDYFKLTPDEKKAYDDMEKSLTMHELTDDDVYLFFNKTMNECEDKLIDPELSMDSRMFWTVYLRLTKNIIRFLDAPKLQVRNARMMLDNQLSKN